MTIAQLHWHDPAWQKQAHAWICADLAEFGIPKSLNHGDFHDGNVLVKDGRITFFDWGDASVTHPFVSLRTFFVSMEIALDLDDYAPPTSEMLALCDRYIARWEGFASKEQLLKAYNVSRPVASIVKMLSWRATISRLDGSLREEYAWIVPEVLREFMVYEKMLLGFENQRTFIHLVYSPHAPSF